MRILCYNNFMLSERIKTLYDALNLSGKEVAASAGVSGSAVSVLRSGKKIPPKDGAFMSKYADAIILLSEKNGSLETLKALVNERDEALLKDKLLSWLYNDTEGKNTDAVLLRRKLSLLMTRLKISNVSLARDMNVDPSVVSRMKSGERGASLRSDLVLSAAHSIAMRISNDRERLIISSALLHQEFDEGMEEAVLENAVYDWLTSDQSGDSSGIQDILATVGNYDSIPMPSSPPDPDEIMKSMGGEKLIKDKTVCYKGISGLRTAVLRFLCSALYFNAREMWLFSNQSMEWMLLDPAYLKKWAALMYACAARGIKIKIIHTINRSLPELTAAVKYWLPLYITGMVESLYIDNLSTAPLLFSNTIFLAPGLACVNSGHPSDADDKAVYRYDTDSSVLSAHKNSYQALLNRSRHLIKIKHSVSDIDRERFIFPEEYAGNIGLFSDGRSATVIRTSPPELVISFYHPLLRRAFTAFIEEI